MARLTNKQIGAIILEEYNHAEGGDTGSLRKNRELALRYYFGKSKGDDVKGRSSLQSTDVADMTEAMLAELIPIFQGDAIVTFDPSGEDDELQAQEESDFVKHILDRKGGYTVIAEILKDSLLQKNGFPKVVIEETEQKQSQVVKGNSEAELEMLLSAAAKQFNDPNLTVTVGDIEKKNDGFEATLSGTRVDRNLKVYSVAPERIRYSQEHNEQFLRGIRFFSEDIEFTRAELVERGISKSIVKKLPASQSPPNQDSLERKAQNTNNTLTSAHKSTDVIACVDVYIMLDRNNNLETDRWRFLWCPNSNNEILEEEIVQHLPYATGSPFPVPHRVTGLSLFDKLKELEDAKRKALRQSDDNMAKMNNAGYIAEVGTVHKQSLLDSGAGRIVWRKRGSSIDAVTPKQAVPFLGESIEYMNYLDKRRTEKGGAALDLHGGEAQIAAKNVGDQGVERQLSVMERMTSMVAMNLGETMIKPLYLLIHDMMREFMPGEINAKLHGKWASTNPSEWPEREDATLNIGANFTQRRQTVALLQEIANDQEGLASAGHDEILVNREGMYKARMDMLRMSNIDNPEQYYIDPESDEAKAAIEKQAQLQAQQAQEEKQVQESLTSVQNQLDKYKVDMDTFTDLVGEQVKLAIEEAKILSSPTPIDEEQNDTGATRPTQQPN